MLRSHATYWGNHSWVWRKERGVVIPVKVRPLDEQPGAAPWVFDLLDPRGQPTGEVEAIPCDQLYRNNRGHLTITTSGVI